MRDTSESDDGRQGEAGKLRGSRDRLGDQGLLGRMMEGILNFKLSRKSPGMDIFVDLIQQEAVQNTGSCEARHQYSK